LSLPFFEANSDQATCQRIVIADHFRLDLAQTPDAPDVVDESHITIEHHGALQVFNKEFPCRRTHPTISR
jgi:Cft2 family RNA processing exonuclease